MTKRARAISILGVSAATLALWIFTAPFLADNLIAERSIEKADVILILSGAADHAQRAEGGSFEFHARKAPMIWITDDGQRGGWDDVEKGNPFFVERMHAALVKAGVPESAIERLPGGVSGTNGEADLAVKTALQRKYQSILIVTSDYHSRRALWTFDQASEANGANLQVGLIRAPSAGTYPDRYTWWLSPRGWSTVGAEYVKFGYYWLYYRF